jgi:hypothetical protein
MPFKACRSVTQGGPLSAKFFNNMVDTVVREWMQLLQEEINLEGEELDEIMGTLFTIFYVDNAYIASRNPVFVQKGIDGLVTTFERFGLETNTKKTQAMTCTPGNPAPASNRILPTDAHRTHTSSQLGCLHSYLQRMQEENAGKKCGRALSDATLRILMRSTSSRWWPKRTGAAERECAPRTRSKHQVIFVLLY